MMKLPVIGKLIIIFSILLLVIGIGMYGLTRFSFIGDEDNRDMLSLVPSDCIGLLDTDNIDFLVQEFSETIYAEQFDTLQQCGLFSLVFENLSSYVDNNVHGLSNRIKRMLVSFHAPSSVHNMVIYFQIKESGKSFIEGFVRDRMDSFVPKKESYRGEVITVYPITNNNFLSVYVKDEFCVISFQKHLIEDVIDAWEGEYSLANDMVFSKVYHSKTTNYMTLYGCTASIPLLAHKGNNSWSEYDVHLTSEVFYLSGEMFASGSFVKQIKEKAFQDTIISAKKDRSLIVSGQSKVDSCILQAIALPSHSLFDECISNLSQEATFMAIMDMDEVALNPSSYKPYLPNFIYRHINLFRSFILSVQLTQVGDSVSHIMVFTYKS